MLRPFLPLALLFTASAATFAGQEVRHGAISLYFENDLFTGTDRYYTNGVKLGWTSPDLEQFSDTPYASPLLPALRLIPFLNDPLYQKNLAFSFGQNIYTPDDTEATGLLEGDRPYAGYLYVGVGLVWKTATVRNSFVLNLGVVGPASLGEEAQRFVHEARKLGFPNGWGNQLHNEFAALGVYDRTWRWPYRERRTGFDWEFLPHLGAAAGNVAIYANAGGEFRLGFNLPDDFGTPSISPGSTTPTPVEGSQRASRLERFDLGAYLFARVDGRAVARNIFIDGNTFSSGAGADRKWFVADVSVGASLNYRDTKVTYAIVYRTKEFYGQEDPQIFGSITLSTPF